MAASRFRSHTTVLLTSILGTLPGRAILAGIAVRTLISLARPVINVPAFPDFTAGGGPFNLPAWLALADMAAGLAIAAGAMVFLVRLFRVVRRRLLWRVRRKLIVSYVFVGLVPALLIVLFFALGGLLLFFNVSSYVMQAELASLGDRARLLATRAALVMEGGRTADAGALLARESADLLPDLSGVSLAIVPFNRACAAGSGAPPFAGPPASRVVTAGPWAHREAPTALPPWMGCDGASAIFADAGGSEAMVISAVAVPDRPAPPYAVVVDLPVNDSVVERLRRQSGVVLLRADGGDGDVMLSGQLRWVAVLDARDWTTGASRPLVAPTGVSVAGIYARVVAAGGLVGDRSLGQTLLILMLVAVGALFLVIEVAALVVGLALAKSITGSVHELTAGTERVRQGNFTTRIAVTAEDELGQLAQSFNSMTASIDDLLRQSAEKKRLEEELRIAHEIQMSLLPQGPLDLPGLSLNALCVPAREVGGDYYDVLPLDDDRVGLLVADVSGKGTSAALYMAELKGLMLSLTRIHTSPRELLISANRIISAHLDARSFITMTYAIVDRRAQTLTYARAGHTPLIHVPGPGAPSRAARVLAPDGLVLGLKIDGGELFERLLEEECIRLREGDLYVLFTDGISEAMNAADDCFGETRLRRLIEAHADAGPEALRARVLEAVESFVGGAPQHDDMTMIVLRVDSLPALEAIAGAPVALAEHH